MKYSAQTNYQSEADIDFSSVESTLLPNGFRITKKDDTSIEFTGRGISSTKENPIRGATKIDLIAKSGVLYLNASLGGVLFMSLFVCLFPPVLILFLSSFNSSDHGVTNYLWSWLLIGPIVSYWLRSRTVKSLNILLENTDFYQSN